MIVTKSLVINRIGPAVITRMEQSLDPQIPGVVGKSMRIIGLNPAAALRLKSLISSFIRNPEEVSNERDEELFSCDEDLFDLFTESLTPPLPPKAKPITIHKPHKPKVHLHTKSANHVEQGKYVDKHKSSSPSLLVAHKGHSVQIPANRESNTAWTNKKVLNSAVKLRGDIDLGGSQK